MRVVSQEALKQLLSENIEHVFTYAFDIIHPKYNDGVPLRFIGDTVPHIINGNEYIPIAFSISMDAAEEDNLPTLNISIANIDPELIALVKSESESPEIKTYVIRIDKQGNAFIELGADSFSVIAVDWDDTAIIFKLGFQRRYLEEPAMKWQFIPGIANGLFQ